LEWGWQESQALPPPFSFHRLHPSGRFIIQSVKQTFGNL
jgi:hypothetical protein